MRWSLWLPAGGRRLTETTNGPTITYLPEKLPPDFPSRSGRLRRKAAGAPHLLKASAA